MLWLIQNDLSDFFEGLQKIKECCSECSENVSHYFNEFPCVPDDFECVTMDELQMLPFLKGWDYMFYEGTDPNDDVAEPAGECWTFSTDEMVGYYKMLDDLYKSKVISEAKYKTELLSMEGFIKDHLCQAPYGYSSIEVQLVYSDAADDGKDCLNIYLDYYYGYYSLFDTYCGLITVFDRYKVKYQELKDTYYSEEELLEAA